MFSFCPSTSSTPRVRADSSSWRDKISWIVPWDHQIPMRHLNEASHGRSPMSHNNPSNVHMISYWYTTICQQREVELRVNMISYLQYVPGIKHSLVLLIYHFCHLSPVTLQRCHPRTAVVEYTQTTPAISLYFAAAFLHRSDHKRSITALTTKHLFSSANCQLILFERSEFLIVTSKKKICACVLPIRRRMKKKKKKQ